MKIGKILFISAILNFMGGALLGYPKIYPGEVIYTKASWYGEELRGKPMANGKPFNPDAYTCASWDYPLGTTLMVTHGDRFVIVTVTDRGPSRELYKKGRRLDLSLAAFRELAATRYGVIEVEIEELTKS